MKKLFLICCLISFFQEINSQELPLISPPSPNASSLGVYADVAVSKYSGIPNIAIPLYEINTNGFSLPISLSYYASGIKVAQEASSVGLGWSLNAGGIITRQIMGKDDFGNFGYVSSGYILPDNLVNPLLSGLLYKTLNGYVYNPRDSEPDIFNFNFAGYSGKFVLTQNGTPVLLDPHSKLIITGYQNKWEIKTPDGIIFEFNDFEKSKNFYQIDQRFDDGSFTNDILGTYGLQYYSSWYLSKISLPNGENITFNYTVSSSKSLQNISVEENVLIDFGGDPVSASVCSPHVLGTTTKSINERIIEKTLNKISWSGGYIDFNNSSREDISSSIYGSSPLKTDGLSVFNNNNKLIKSYAFDYSYFNEGKVAVSKKKKYWRLKLNSVTELSNNGQEKPPYVFNYQSLAGYEYDLPSKESTSTDFWGYFNGQENIDEYGNSIYIPEYEKVNPDGSYQYYAGADRKCYPAYLKLGILNQIKNPTGGITQFEYEPNRYASFDAYNYHYTESTVEAEACNFDYCGYWGDSSMPATSVKEFYVGSNPFSKKRVLFSVFSENFASSFPEPISAGSYAKLEKITGENGTVQSVITSIGYGIEWTSNLNTLPACSNCYSYEGRAYLSSGWYRLTVTPATDLYAKATITIHNRTENGEREGAGLRIVKIINDAKERNFDYKSSGILLSDHDYSYFEKKIENCGDVFYSYKEYIVRRSGSISSLTGFKSGQSVGYGQVNEFLKDENGNISATEQTFHNNAETPNKPFFPNIPRLINGSLIKEKYFNNSNLLRETTFNYSLLAPVVSVPAFIYTHLNNWGFYYRASERRELTEKIDKLFFENDLSNPVTSTTNYFYDNPAHFQLTRTKVTNSKGEKLLTKNYYPNDVNGVSSLGGDPLNTTEELPAINKLKDQYRIAEPIQVDVYKDLDKDGVFENSELLSRQRTNYKIWPSGIVLPKDIEDLKGTYNSSNKLEDRLIYHDYDAYGNPLEVSKTDGTHIVYIWGYNHTQPIAKIENSTCSDISSSLITDIQNKSNNDTDNCREANCKEQILRNALNTLRTNLPNALVTTYTYDPLIGVTSITDPRGDTVYYEYDDFNRLKHVKDKDGHILSENEYNYKPQN